MKKMRIVLALFIAACGASVSAQYDDGGAIGNICEAGEYCPPPMPVDGGGQGHIDPSPYDPQPGRPNRPGRPQQPRPDRPNYPTPGMEVYLGQYFRNQPLNLNRVFGLSSWENRGQEVRSVTLMVSDPDAFANLDLIADGFVVASDSRPRHIVTLVPRKRLVFGQSLETLLVNIRGGIFIERVAIDLGGGYGGGGGYPAPGQGQSVLLPAHLNQSFYSPVNLALAPVLNLRNYPNFELTEVVVVGNALNHSTTARIMIDNQVVGIVKLKRRLGAQSILLNGYVVGHNLRQLNLLVDGPAFIERVEAQLQRY